MKSRVRTALLLAAALVAGCGSGKQGLILATTTSLQDTGLLDVLVPAFEKETGYKVKTIAVGTGQALEMAGRGEADVVVVHAPEAEKRAVAQGVAVDRRLVMYNDFVLVGPPGDPARIRGLSVLSALQKIAAQSALFISRGDDSGTHKKERGLWDKAGVKPAGSWYQEAGLGMGQTLSLASEKEAYTLTDRSTFLAMRGEIRLEIAVEGNPDLLNFYHVMRVNPAKFSKVEAAGARDWADFLLSPQGQQLIGQFGAARFGRPLFTPAAGRTEEEVIAASGRLGQ